MKNKILHHFFIYGLGLLLTGIAACSWSLNFQLERINIPQLISSSVEDKEMRRWTVVDFGIHVWDWVIDDRKPEKIKWQKLVVCHDPTAQFWIFNDFQTNTMTDCLGKVQWSIFSVKESKMDILPDLTPVLSNLLKSTHGIPFGSFNQTNVFDVTAFQTDLPNCDTLFLATDKNRGNKAVFKRYRFSGDYHGIADIQLAFLNETFSILFSTDSYAELVEYMAKNNEN